MKKEVSEMVWPVENYTDKIHTGLKMMFITYPWLSFTIPQMRQHLTKGYNWLANPTEAQTALLDKLIKTGIQKLIQLGTVKKVTSKVSVESQWQATAAVADSGMVNITSEDSVAHTEEARKAVKRRALGGKSLHVLNGQGKFGQLH
jgi:hypothetical protein